MSARTDSAGSARGQGEPTRLVILGAGPAGLTAAWEAMKQGIPAEVFEKDDLVGGISRTVVRNGYHFDIGGHRFFSKVAEVEQIWHEILGDDLLVRPRLSRIYYNDTLFDYPIRPLNALRGLGIAESTRVIVSFLYAQMFPSVEERTFEQWVSNRFGRRLFEIFFKTYTEKVWGMDCSEIRADWAAQRIQDLDLGKALRQALLGGAFGNGRVVTSLIEQFYYPRRGPGMLWERCQETLAGKGYPTHLESEVVRVSIENGRVREVVLRGADGAERHERGSDFISSLPLRDLLNRMEPQPPAEILEAANRLRYRDFLTVALAVKGPDLFPDNWIYIHSPDVHVGRIQNFGNWSPEMVPDPQTSSLGLEYFVQEGDALWSASDEDLIELAGRECAQLGFIAEKDVIEGAVVRMPKAYPVYDPGYDESLAIVRGFLEGIENLTCVGRNGQHRYNNQDHSMVTALRAVRNLNGAGLEVWDVNVDDDYHEAIASDNGGGDRIVPKLVAAQLDEDLLQTVFARYDPLALGVAVGVTGALGLFLATLVLLIADGDPLGPTLSILGIILLGYKVSWAGLVIGTLEGGVMGFLFGQLLARTINRVVSWNERLFRVSVQFMRATKVSERVD